MKLLRILVTIILASFWGVSGIKINCKEDLYNSWLDIKRIHSCGVKSIEFSKNETIVEEISGLKGETPNEDIVIIDFTTYDNDEKPPIFPRGLSKFFPDLYFIKMEHMELSELDGTELEEFPSLYWISFSRNNLELIPGNLFVKNPEIRRTYLYSNQISILDENLLRNLTKLEVIDFDYNKIKSIPTKFFRDNLSLKKINFASNKISNLDENLLVNLRKLEIVNFSGNRITHIPGNFFRDNQYLKEIDFNRNRLISIGQYLLDSMFKLERFNFEYNFCINYPTQYDNYNLTVLKEKLRDNCEVITPTTLSYGDDD